MAPRCSLFLAFVLSAGAVVFTRAAEPSVAPTSRAMELLRANCLACHNAEKHKGGLQLTTRDAALKGGDNGPVIVAGQPEASPLVRSLAADAEPHMPPKKQLTDEQVALLQDWVKAGAAWDEAVLADRGQGLRTVQFGPLPDNYQPALALALAPDEKRLAVARGNRVHLHDLTQTNQPVAGTLEGARDVVQKLAWSRDGRWIAGADFRRVLLWDARTRQLAHTLTNHLVSRVTALDFSPDGTRLVAADGVPSRSGVLHVWTIPDGAAIASWPAHKDSVLDLEVSHDGRRVATASADRLVKVWDLPTQQEVSRLEGHLGHVLAVTFNTNDTQVCSGGADREIKVWNVKTREKLINVGRANTRISDLAWTPDSSHLVAVGDDGTPRRFSEFKVHTGAQSSETSRERSLTDVEDVLYAVAVSADGNTVYAGGHEGLVYQWNKDGKVLGRLGPPA
jgi:WD40 repeat protein